jgi:hypothetical protein
MREPVSDQARPIIHDPDLYAAYTAAVTAF